MRSKWLPEDDDVAWREKKERINVSMESGGGSGEIVASQLPRRSDSRMQMQIKYTESNPLNEDNTLKSGPGGKEISKLNFGLEDEELIRLDLVDRKRARGGPTNYETMDTVGGLQPLVANNKNTSDVVIF